MQAWDHNDHCTALAKHVAALQAYQDKISGTEWHMPLAWRARADELAEIEAALQASLRRVKRFMVSFDGLDAEALIIVYLKHLCFSFVKNK